jgi:hypothetical protein
MHELGRRLLTLQASLGTNSSHGDHLLCPDLGSIDESIKVNWLDRRSADLNSCAIFLQKSEPTLSLVTSMKNCKFI